MAVELLIGTPHVLRAHGVGSNSPTLVQWQVFFLPQYETPSKVKSFIAFCPFTGIKATGTSTATAAKAWLKLAKKNYPDCAFSIPKYLITSCKVWFGEKNSVGIYVIDLEI